MKKYVYSLIFLTLLFSLVGTKEVQADFGPKRSLNIIVVGVDEPYSLDLLVDDGETVFFTPEELEYHTLHYYLDTFPSILNGYEDEDGFKSHHLYSSIVNISRTSYSITSQEFELNYHPPHSFKIVLVTENDVLIISEIIILVAFNSYVTLDLSNDDTSFSQSNVGTVTGNLDEAIFHIETAIHTALRIIFTVLIEIGILFAFKYRKKKSFVIVTSTNIITQLIISLIVISAAYYGGVLFAVILLILLEICVFIVEGITYILFLKEQSKMTALAYTIIANLGSLAIGFFFLDSI